MPRGSKPGERRGGRAKGTPNKATRELKDIAGQHTEAAIAQLAHLMKFAESEQARVSAARELLDRSHGKPAQAHLLGGDPNNPTPIRQIIHRLVTGTEQV